MAGYSGVPLARKLGIKEGSTVLLVGAPDGFEAELVPLPDGAECVRNPGPADLALLFVTRRADLAGSFSELTAYLPPAGALWVAWPKKAPPKGSVKVPTDVTENVLREVLLPTGWVDVKVCAVTEVWSGVKFVLRLVNRPKP